MIAAANKRLNQAAADVWPPESSRGWPVLRLRFCATVNPSRSELNCLPEDTEISFVPMESVCEYGGLRLDQTKPLADVSTGYTYFRDGDVVVAKITPCFENGKGSIARGLTSGVGFGTTELHVLRPTPRLDPAFLFYLTISHPFRSIGAAYMYGAGGQKRVPDDFVRDFRHPIPALDEQRAVARFLDRETARIDALIEKKRRQIELLHEKRAALISHAVTKGLDPNSARKDSGIDWLGSIPAHWTTNRIKHVAEIRGGQVDPRIAEYSAMPLVAPNHIESRTGRLIAQETADAQGAISGKYRFKSSDVLYSKIRPALAKACIAPFDGLCSADMYAMVPKPGYSAQYVLYLLLSDAFTRLAVDESMRVAMPKINREDLGELRLPIAAEADQARIVEYLATCTSAIDRVIMKINLSIERLREYRTALISAAVTGKIDVRQEAA